MAIKYFCDQCKKEITPKEDVSEFKYVENTFMLDKEPQKQAVAKLFCGSCTDKVKKFIETLK
ncbi:MAG TPA: hypothetical protein ENI23_05290 [bacterium]|nr:hypothetical protein [bacterium]